MSCEPGHEVPQAPAIARREPGRADAVERPRAAVQVQPPVDRGGVRARRQPDDRVDALGGRPEQRSHDPVEAGQRLGEPGSVGPAGVHRGECDRSATPPRPLAHQRHLGPFSPRVRARPVVVAARELEVVERQALRVHAARGHGDHARPRRLAEEGFEAMLERERTDNEERQGQFDAVGALGSRRMDRAGVVDQDVEPRLGRQDPIDRRRDRVERPRGRRRPRRKRSAPCAATRASRRCSSRASLRPTRITRAPRSATAHVAASPRPEVGPVTRTVRPARAPGSGPVHANRRRRTAGPMRLKLPMTETSSVASTAVANV